MIRFPITHLWDGTPGRPDEAVTVEVTLGAQLAIHVDAPLHGDPAPAGPPGPTWMLWEHEVVELFVLGAGGAYTEIEIGPHGHHLVLQLDGVRSIAARELPLSLTVDTRDGRWRATAALDAALLPAGPHRVNAYAIHGVGDARRYLAWAPVPGDGPDFHRLEHFRPVDLTR